MRLRGIALTLLLVGGAVATTTTASANQAIDDCVQAEDFGAVPNDGADDRVQLQAAIDAAQAGPRCLAIGPGTFHATRKPTPGAASIPSLRITGTLALRGAGADATVLAMFGSGILPGETAPRDWRLLDVSGATDVSVSDLSFDGSARTGTGEQTHLLHLTGPTEHVVVERASFTLPVIGPSTGGDCIRLLGEVDKVVRDTTIRDVTGPDCDRSFVGLQRGVDGLVIERSESVRVGDQAIDFEPTNGQSFDCQPTVRNVLMRALTLRRQTTQGLTVTIHGDGCAVADNVTLADSVIEDGTVSILDATNVTLSRLRLTSLPGSSAPTVLARKRIQNLRILDSVIERVAQSGAGNSAVQISNQSGAFPTDVLLSGVRVEQATTGPLISTDGLARLTVLGTQLVYTGPPQNACAVNLVGRAAQPVESPVLVDTSVQGALAAVACVHGIVNGQPVLVRVTGP
jgi:hypothetical protein